MTTFNDIPADMLIEALVEHISTIETIVAPEWASFVKTGTHRERPPNQDNWWSIRAAAILRKVAFKGPIGANHISQEFGGPRDRGVKPNRAAAGSRNIARTILQQLTDAGMIKSSFNASGSVNYGKILTPAGHKLINDVAHSVRPKAEEKYPGLSNY
ncbi:MAG: 30S ribosomal protein S19e [Candidatus Thalassarchaeaceae archaeon]|nr:30S ribosomal protein S19e [Candidatus Thalassarchaeaceae archaeon]